MDAATMLVDITFGMRTQGTQVVYILTLGVAEEARRRGVAGQLLRLVISAAGDISFTFSASAAAAMLS